MTAPGCADIAGLRIAALVVDPPIAQKLSVDPVDTMVQDYLTAAVVKVIPASLVNPLNQLLSPQFN